MAGPVRLSSKSTKCGPSGVHSTLPTWQAQRGYVASPLVAAAHAIERLVDHAAVRGQQFGRNEIVGQQVAARFFAKGGDVDGRPFVVSGQRADGVNAADEAPGPFQRGRIIEFGRAPSAARKHGKAEAAETVQRGAVQGQRRHHGDFTLSQLLDKSVLFEDGRLAPALWAVKLGHHRRALLHADLVHAVLVTVQGQKAAVGVHADRIERVQHAFGAEGGKRMQG
jgi:hypothetical protein